MAELTQTVRVCDVYGVSRGVRKIIIEVREAGVMVDGLPTPPVFEWGGDLGERAVKRLVRFIERGVSCPR